MLRIYRAILALAGGPTIIGRRAILGCLFLSFLLPIGAQGDDVQLVNGRKIDPRRYEGYEGSPYQFADWPRGNIITTNYHRFYDIALNYNSYTGEFEVRNRDEYIELEPSYYLRIELPVTTAAGEPDTLLFQKGLMPGKPQDFHQLIYLTREMILLKQWVSLVDKIKVNNVSEIVEERKFKSRFFYYLIANGQVYTIKLGSNRVWKLLGIKKQARDFIEREQLETKEEEDFIRVLEHFGTT